jgi:hypothetical protein
MMVPSWLKPGIRLEERRIPTSEREVKQGVESNEQVRDRLPYVLRGESIWGKRIGRKVECETGYRTRSSERRRVGVRGGKARFHRI